MKYLLLIFSLGLAASNAFALEEFSATFDSKIALFQKLSEIPDLGTNSVIEIEASKKITSSMSSNIHVLETDSSHSHSKYLGDSFSINSEPIFNYVDQENPNVLHVAFQVGDLFICYKPSKKRSSDNEWTEVNKRFKHCFFFPKSVSKVTEKIREIYQSPTGPR